MIEETEESNFCCDRFHNKEDIEGIDHRTVGDTQIEMWRCKACKNETWIYSKLLKYEIYSEDGKLF